MLHRYEFCVCVAAVKSGGKAEANRSTRRGKGGYPFLSWFVSKKMGWLAFTTIGIAVEINIGNDCKGQFG